MKAPFDTWTQIQAKIVFLHQRSPFKIRMIFAIRRKDISRSLYLSLNHLTMNSNRLKTLIQHEHACVEWLYIYISSFFFDRSNGFLCFTDFWRKKKFGVCTRSIDIIHYTNRKSQPNFHWEWGDHLMLSCVCHIQFIINAWSTFCRKSTFMSFSTILNWFEYTTTYIQLQFGSLKIHFASNPFYDQTFFFSSSILKIIFKFIRDHLLS